MRVSVAGASVVYRGMYRFTRIERRVFDLAVEIPLPDETARRALIERCTVESPIALHDAGGPDAERARARTGGRVVAGDRAVSAAAVIGQRAQEKIHHIVAPDAEAASISYSVGTIRGTRE